MPLRGCVGRAPPQEQIYVTTSASPASSYTDHSNTIVQEKCVSHFGLPKKTKNRRLHADMFFLSTSTLSPSGKYSSDCFNWLAKGALRFFFEKKKQNKKKKKTPNEQDSRVEAPQCDLSPCQVEFKLTSSMDFKATTATPSGSRQQWRTVHRTDWHSRCCLHAARWRRGPWTPARTPPTLGAARVRPPRRRQRRSGWSWCYPWNRTMFRFGNCCTSTAPAKSPGCTMCSDWLRCQSAGFFFTLQNLVCKGLNWSLQTQLEVRQRSFVIQSSPRLTRVNCCIYSGVEGQNVAGSIELTRRTAAVQHTVCMSALQCERGGGGEVCNAVCLWEKKRIT